jgi:hypothetical protein
MGETGLWSTPSRSPLLAHLLLDTVLELGKLLLAHVLGHGLIVFQDAFAVCRRLC